MPKLPDQRRGTDLVISKRRLDFSRWPTTKRRKAYTLQPEVLSNSPWDVIEYKIKEKYRAKNKQRSACLAFLEQAKDFYFASDNHAISSRPLLLYYSFLNLAKSFILFKGIEDDLDRAMHGLSEDRQPHSRTFLKATLKAHPSKPSGRNIFDLFGRALGGSQLQSTKSLRVVKHLIPQVVIGHRLWAAASGQAERFLRCQRIELRHSKLTKELWLRILIAPDDLDRCGVSHSGFLKRAGLANFREVKPHQAASERGWLVFEQTKPISYTRRPSDEVHTLVKVLEAKVWPVVRAVPDYRRYYLSVYSPATSRLHPILSVYALCFYLGSVTRYRPDEFEMVQDSRYGMFVAEFLATQARQFWYHMASEFGQQLVSSPAVVR